MIVNIGEANASVSTPLVSLGLSPTAEYDVTNLWTGERVGAGAHKGDAVLVTALRPHASALFRIQQRV
jgi:hypothetical protein